MNANGDLTFPFILCPVHAFFVPLTREIICLSLKFNFPRISLGIGHSGLIFSGAHRALSICSSTSFSMFQESFLKLQISEFVLFLYFFPPSGAHIIYMLTLFLLACYF